MKTYLMVLFSSEGSAPQEVADRLTSLGFKPVHGEYDFAYPWVHSPSVEEVLSFGDQVHKTLKGMKVMFKMETV
ncbi:TPA: hypothetical protein HA244_03015 [Candidatus Micrarchaeota archaeon]|nr:hypothetical protein [Candidatus Micrarchaeota archaeon]